MTTSTNKTVIEGSMKGGVAKATSVTLAGVLAVGMVPAAAFAADVAEDDSIAPLTATDVEAFNGGYVSAINTTVETGWSLTVNQGAFSSKAIYAPQANPISETLSLENLTLTLADGQTLTGSSNELPSTNYQIQYYAADSNGNKVGNALNAITTTGNYIVEIVAKAGKYEGGVISLPVTVKSVAIPANLVTLPFNADGTVNYSPAQVNQFTFTGNPVKLALGQGTAAPYTAPSNFTEGVDYQIKMIPQGSTVDAAGVTVVDQGKYSAVISGLGVYAGSVSSIVNFKVQPFDLSGSTAIAKTVVGSNTLPTNNDIISITNSDGVALNTDQVQIDAASLTGVNAANKPLVVFGEPGKYTLTLKPLKNSENVENSVTMDFFKVASSATFAYGNKTTVLPTSVSIDNSATTPVEFDPSKIIVMSGNDILEQSVTPSGGTATEQYSVQVSKDGGKTFGAIDNTVYNNGTWVAGKYVVKVAVDPENLVQDGIDKYSVGGEQLINLNVTDGKINASANATFNYNGKAFTALTLPYGGAAGYAQNVFTTHVTDAAGQALTAGSDYTVKITDADGKTVAGNLVNAGTYTFTLTSDKYDVSGNNSATVTIEKVNLTDLKFVAGGTAVVAVNGNVYVDTSAADVPASDLIKQIQTSYVTGTNPTTYEMFNNLAVYTGNEVTAQLQEQNDEGKWVAATQIDQNDNGNTYRVVIAPANNTITDNATFASDEGTILYIGSSDGAWKFDDVAPTQWYFKPVANATQGVSVNGSKLYDNFMNGYAGTRLFGPNDRMTRAQVACILYNMARNANTDAVDEALGGITGANGTTYPSFDDVDSAEYYAKAVAWAKATGVVNGYAGTNNFKPDQIITREQFACMLWNYATEIESSTISGVDVEKALASMPDGGKVSDYAKSAVAWAVQNKIMGNGGVIDPSSVVTRAEAAAMGVNFLGKNNA